MGKFDAGAGQGIPSAKTDPLPVCVIAGETNHCHFQLKGFPCKPIITKWLVGSLKLGAL